MLALTMLCLCLGACGEPDTPVTDPAASTGKPTDKPADTTGSTQPSSEPITITFWHTYGDSEEAQFRDVVLPLWEKAHPDIHVEAVRQDSSQYHQMIVTSFGTGMSPDVARVDIANIAAYAKQGGLAALSDYADFAELSKNYLEAPCPPTSIRANITVCPWTPTVRPPL